MRWGASDDNQLFFQGKNKVRTIAWRRGVVDFGSKIYRNDDSRLGDKKKGPPKGGPFELFLILVEALVKFSHKQSRIFLGLCFEPFLVVSDFFQFFLALWS
jgi:hypothetical protein